ncbi:MAG: 7TM diverse intracellular signaling domain-containing protein, partial [Halieaceae bacterium]|nr:7TM diverse intracellular signaling domain-containing protein [Halieaceae bacterium]
MDLSDWNWREQGTVSLSGEWLFYPDVLLSPAQVTAAGNADTYRNTLLKVPAAWDIAKANGLDVNPRGVGTYVLHLTLPADAPPLALGKIDSGTAHRFFVDQTLVHSAGEVGTTPATTVPGFNRSFAIIPDNSATQRTLVVQVANFDYRTGGLWEPITFGVRESVYAAAAASLAYAVFLASGIGVIGLYHIGLFSQRREDPSPLYFALLCLAISFRVLSIDDRFILQVLPFLNFSGMLRIEFISFLLAPPAFAGFMRSAMQVCYS